MPVKVTQWVNTELYLIRYGIESLEWYEADSQADAFAILTELSKRSYLLVEWEQRNVVD